MPAMSDAELADAVAEGCFGAMTLDTSVFDQFECNLDYRALRSLGPVASQHGVALIFTDVTAREVQAHIARAATDQAAKLTAALNQYRKAWRRPENEASALTTTCRPTPQSWRKRSGSLS
ncbi:hypothetical protein [Hansschlegelia beijingensis]|uniref:Uncharacterized protein n=1 Tax=Hansschlegelia beijingensis TaxID=1133344 RepID=A0A7W6GFP1_9HYPH|nr:hypothetical protein [Hansschlegelia beijingensis]MBB3971854.1 hypothetical protein [Hansschlegelia beijingensis]